MAKLMRVWDVLAAVAGVAVQAAVEAPGWAADRAAEVRYRAALRGAVRRRGPRPLRRDLWLVDGTGKPVEERARSAMTSPLGKCEGRG